MTIFNDAFILATLYFLNSDPSFDRNKMKHTFFIIFFYYFHFYDRWMWKYCDIFRDFFHFYYYYYCSYSNDRTYYCAWSMFYRIFFVDIVRIRYKNMACFFFGVCVTNQIVYIAIGEFSWVRQIVYDRTIASTFAN